MRTACVAGVLLLLLVCGCDSKPSRPINFTPIFVLINDLGEQGTKLELRRNRNDEFGVEIYNVEVEITMKLEDGSEEQVKRFWASWGYDDDTKIVELSARNVQTVHVSGKANHGEDSFHIYGTDAK